MWEKAVVGRTEEAVFCIFIDFIIAILSAPKFQISDLRWLKLASFIFLEYRYLDAKNHEAWEDDQKFIDEQEEQFDQESQ